jgi:hypothetical protein
MIDYSYDDLKWLLEYLGYTPSPIEDHGDTKTQRWERAKGWSTPQGVLISEASVEYIHWKRRNFDPFSRDYNVFDLFYHEKIYMLARKEGYSIGRLLALLYMRHLEEEDFASDKTVVQLIDRAVEKERKEIAELIENHRAPFERKYSGEHMSSSGWSRLVRTRRKAGT